MFAVKHK